MKNEFNCPMLGVNIFEMGSHLYRQPKSTFSWGGGHYFLGLCGVGNVFMTVTAVKTLTSDRPTS